jgi:hypothetical protein
MTVFIYGGVSFNRKTDSANKLLKIIKDYNFQFYLNKFTAILQNNSEFNSLPDVDKTDFLKIIIKKDDFFNIKKNIDDFLSKFTPDIKYLIMKDINIFIVNAQKLRKFPEHQILSKLLSRNINS